MCTYNKSQIKGLISLSFDSVYDLFDRFDIDRKSIDISGRNEAMFNSAFIKIFIQYFGKDVFEFFKGKKEKFFAIEIPTISFNEVTNDFEKK